MAYERDYVMRLIEQMGAALRRAVERFAQGAPLDEAIAATDEAIRAAVELPTELFLQMSPPSMVSLLELSNADDLVICKVAEALRLQADLYDSAGMIIEARVRREQADAMLEFIDPARAN